MQYQRKHHRPTKHTLSARKDTEHPLLARPRFNQVQHRVRLMAPSCDVVPPAVTLNIFSPVTVPLPAKRPASSTAPPAPPGGAGGGDEKAKSPVEGAGGGKKDDKKKKKKGAAAGEESAAAAAAGTPGTSKKGGGGDAAPAAAAAAAPVAVVEGDPSKLDVRVGVIVKAWEHPDSEKLFCEEIDLGEVSLLVLRSVIRPSCGLTARHCVGWCVLVF